MSISLEMFSRGVNGTRKPSLVCGGVRHCAQRWARQLKMVCRMVWSGCIAIEGHHDLEAWWRRPGKLKAAVKPREYRSGLAPSPDDVVNKSHGDPSM